MKKLNKKGFTLIELLAVIVILGIIMLIAIPSVSSIIRNSRQNTFRSSAQTLIAGARNMALSTSTGMPVVSNSAWEEVNISSIDTKKMGNANFVSDNYTGGYIIHVKDVDVESGSNTQSSYGEKLDNEYSYILALLNKDTNKLDYYIQLYDAGKNAIKLVNEANLENENIVDFNIEKTAILSFDNLKKATA